MMGELSAIHTPALALVAGLITSLHCAGMCGPLACMLASGRGAPGEALTVTVGYQVARLLGYTTLGAGAGALGAAPVRWLQGPLALALPWVLVIFFAAVALRIDGRLPRSVGLARLLMRVRSALSGRSRLGVAVAMGALTPLLPCGPLYFLVAIAAVSGSAARGAEFLLAFGLGTLPLLWLVQANVGWLQRRLSPRLLGRWQTGLAVTAAVVVSWRLRSTLGFEGPAVGDFLCQ